MHGPFSRRVFAIAMGLGLLAPLVHATDEGFAKVMLVSDTLGNNAGRLCAGASGPLRAADVGCPSYAPSLTTAGDVSVTGNLSAAQFIGDGSLLTGVSGGDRITSGTSNVIVNTNGAISFTTAGSQRMVIDSSGNVGIGKTTPGSTFDVSGTINASTEFRLGNLPYTRVATLDSGGGWGGGYNFNWNNANPKHNSLGVMGGFGFDSSRGISFFANSSQAANTLAMERVRITPGGNVGIGTTDPQATLQVSGSLIVSTSAQTTTPSLYVGTNGNVGVGTAIPQAKLDVVGGRVRIQDTSASLAFVSSGASRVGLVYQNVDNLNLAADTVGVMASFSLLAPDGSFKLSSAGNVGIGTTAPAKTLDVSGTARITSNTEVSGTIKLSGIDGEACTPDKYGTMRFNPVTKALQICRK